MGTDFLPGTRGHSCPLCGSCCRSSQFHDQPPLDREAVFAKLRSGYLPTDDEKSAITVNVQECLANLGAINKELNQLKVVINRLEIQHADLELDISYQSALLSPIRRLPDELLGEIMLHVSQGPVDVCAPQSDIWKLEKVCRRWQNVATSTPEIWSSIHVFLGNLTRYKAGIPVSTVARLAKLCVQRSADRSLSIKFIEIGSPIYFEDLFALFSLFSQRWQFISFSMSMLSDAPSLENGLSRLKSLCLSGAYNGLSPFYSFQHAQRLTELRLLGVSKPLRTLFLPWSQLTYFKAFNCEFRTGEFMELLHRMPNLVEFDSRWNKGVMRNHAGSLKPIHLHCLRILEIEASPAEISTILQPLTCANLDELYLVTQASPTPAFPVYFHISDAVVNAIRRSQCCITTLNLSSVDSACVCHIIEGTPHLVNLDLRHIHQIEITLYELSRPRALVPLLERFSLTCKLDQGMFSVGPLTEMVRARSSLSHDTQESAAHFRGLDLTLREKRGVAAITDLLEPLSQHSGVAITIHSLAT